MMTALTRPSKSAGASAWLPRAIGALVAVAGLWLVFNIQAAGQPLVALGVLVLLAAGLYTYLSRAGFAWRYLFPGVVGMGLFVAFPLLYTAQIGFTNYSSAHLLSEERVRAYLLDQADIDVEHSLTFTLHPDAAGGGVKMLLQGGPADAPTRYVTPVIRHEHAGQAWDLNAAALDGNGNPAGLGPALPLREALAWREHLQGLHLALPGGARLSYAGVREFGPATPVWLAQADASLKRQEDGAVYRPNPQTGYFENAQGEHLQPGYKVGVGLANYERMLGDKEFRGPFFSIFIWTVLFAALTVVCACGLGMTLAVLLNWESLRYRTLYRTLLFLPYAVPGFISILVFKGLFNQNFGEINAILNAVFGVKPAWFSDPLLAKLMLLLVNTWLGYPYFLVLCTGLIKAIPADLYEASALAGAKPLTNFFKITAPLIIKPLSPLLISAFAFNFNNFVLISLLTNGRPDFLNSKIPAGTTDILVSYTYRIAFLDSGQNFGLAAAISTVIFFLVALMSLANLRFSAAANGSSRGGRH